MLIIKKKYGKNIIQFNSIRSKVIINDLINIFNMFKDNKKVNFVLDFTNLKSAAYPHSLVLIAGIADYYKTNYNYNISFVSKEGKYFSHTRADRPTPVTNENDEHVNNIFDQVVTFASSSDVSYISETISNYLWNNIQCSEGVLIGLSWCMNEIMDNALLHSNVSKGYFMAQIHKENKRISISIYDNGIGLKESINSSNIYRAETDSEAINQVIKKGVTCNPQVGQGNGMWGLYEIVKENKGYMSIKTGDVQHEYRFEGNDPIINTKNSFISKNNKGTCVDFTIKFDKFIDINKALDSYIPHEYISRNIEDNFLDENYININILEQAKEGLGTRNSGKKMRIFILNTMEIEKSPILLDFSNIKIISSSFADEFLGKLANEVGILFFSNHFKIKGANSYIEGIINKAITERLAQKTK